MSTTYNLSSKAVTKPVKVKSFRTYYILISLIVFVFLLSEVILRRVYGFTNAILMREDKAFEYIPVPQDRYRFFKNNYYNSYSQRNREITTNDSTIILGFGDSVINGGVQTEQDSLATSLLSNYLTQKNHQQVLVTNIAAGSWGPDNCYAYLKKYGNFGAKKLLLVVSSHDAYDNMNFEKIVGVIPSYPDKQYQLAITELFDRYLYPRYLSQYFSFTAEKTPEKNNNLLISKYKNGMQFNSGFKHFANYSDSTKIPLLIYLHADQEELKQGTYNEQGKEIIAFCAKNNIPLINELNYKFSADDYRDGIHLSEKGQRHMYDILKSRY
ncbi:SGNH/GDSL hydrolase family protein [Hymenobacter wooponensis]|uniref:SGNH/GDSL hydrolase family protein n=1 Tax=Hymenobacter wooponensis TaxID=1525360 RepID=A0A4Z0MQX7_9BACT|nr:hypothetical protein [Hymenobacter wooponensis]TGD82233.1 hypothetical protein EU557_00115 [Hymenobacter wooponensis]